VANTDAHSLDAEPHHARDDDLYPVSTHESDGPVVASQLIPSRRGPREDGRDVATSDQHG
jgi:hypothetical protein